MVSTFVLFGVGESAFAQSGLVKVQKRSLQKRVVKETPRIMPNGNNGDTEEGEPDYTTPPVYITQPGGPSGGGSQLFPTPIVAPPTPPGFFPTLPGIGPPRQQPGDGAPPSEEVERVQNEFCTCIVEEYSKAIDSSRNVNCTKTPTDHHITRLSYTSTLRSSGSIPAKSHSEVCLKGEMSSASKIKRLRITDYPNCGDDNSQYFPLPIYPHDRCSN